MGMRTRTAHAHDAHAVARALGLGLAMALALALVLALWLNRRRAHAQEHEAFEAAPCVRAEWPSAWNGVVHERGADADADRTFELLDRLSDRPVTALRTAELPCAQQQFGDAGGWGRVAPSRLPPATDAQLRDALALAAEGRPVEALRVRRAWRRSHGALGHAVHGVACFAPDDDGAAPCVAFAASNDGRDTDAWRPCGLRRLGDLTSVVEP